MSPILRLVARIVEGEEKSQVWYDSSVYKRDNNDDSDDDSNEGNGLPLYAILLTVYFSILFLVFWSSFVYYWKRQKEREKDGQPFRVDYIFWKASSAATGIAVWLWFFKKLGWCGSERKKDRTTGIGPYEEIRSRQLHSSAGVPTPSPSPPGARPTDPNAPAWYGASASQKTTYGPYEQPYGNSPKYNPAHQAFTQHDSIPMITLSPSPNLSPSPSPSPSLKPNPSYTPPPPYISNPPPAAIYGQKFQSQYTGPPY
ncbi:hypothetical protein GQX73_g2913 [Xylaria multiplex]|uniref:Uncharacterized protein n=1 Tax=Xylaria multiplex TaxID=323545 RepID=A0A7C8MVS9_9PEZI|nr:hypothetical protein GQX73_g2913 [Xylaria multiplex]